MKDECYPKKHTTAAYMEPEKGEDKRSDGSKS